MSSFFSSFSLSSPQEQRDNPREPGRWGGGIVKEKEIKKKEHGSRIDRHLELH